MMKTKSMSSKADVLDGHLTEIRWQERITNKEDLKMAEIENVNEDVRIKEKMEIHSPHHEERTTK